MHATCPVCTLNLLQDGPRLAMSLSQLSKDIRGCTACGLHEITERAVFGEGSARSQVMFVGEQPGDREDREGHPFVGPAGRILDKALEEAGIDRKLVYVTNAVKRFNHSERGKRDRRAPQGRAHQGLSASGSTRNWQRSSRRCSCASARCPRRRSSAAR